MKISRFFICMLLLAATSPLFAQQRINDLTGINSHPFEPISLQKRFSWVRAWHDWSNDIGFAPSNSAGCPDISNAAGWNFSWNPSGQQSGPLLDYDAYYSALGQRGIPVLKGTAPVLRGLTAFPTGCPQPPLEQKPLCLPGNWQNWVDDPTGCGLPKVDDLPFPTNNSGGQEDPSSYAQHALWISFFAAKYGQAMGGYSTALMQPYTSDDPLIINRNLIQYLEDNNEPNKSWWDPGATEDDFKNGNTLFYFSPDQFAAMLKADFDGNGLSINGQVPLGMSNSSSGVQLVMGGLAGLNGQYLLDMNPIQLPGGTIANFHHYCTDQSSAQQTNGQFIDNETGEFKRYYNILLGAGGEGVSPEADNLRQKLFWLKDLTPDFNEYWFTEFGYDSFPEGYGTNYSGLEAAAIDGDDGHYDSQKVQAQWLVRGVLETAWSKAIDKMMLFELADNPTLGNNNYRFSGLMTDRFVAKRAWYYIMTLKNRLGEYAFDKEIIDGLPVGNGNEQFKVVTSSGTTNIRIYEFRKSENEIIYAIWSPTSEAIAPFTCDITFPDFENYSPLNGATLYEIQELSEIGKSTNWSEHVSGQTISDIPVSETPVFLRINKSYLSYPPISHVTNFSCEARCCGAVDLSWSYSGVALQTTRNTLVFYREKEGDECPPFSFTESTLFANYIGISKKSVTVTGLEEGKEYCFYVIPVSIYGTVPDDLKEALACSTLVLGSSNAITDMSSDYIFYDPKWAGVGGVNPALVSQVETLLGVGGQNSCSDIYGPPCNPNDLFTNENAWTFWQDPAPQVGLNEPNTFFINFPTPQKINVIYAQDWTGNGEILIEYKDCKCSQYRKLTKLELKGFPPPCDNDGNPTVIQHTDFPKRVVTGLKITKLQPTASLRRLYFCAKEAECPQNRKEPSVTKDFRIDEIRYNSAMLKWTATEENVEESGETYLAEGYEIDLSEQVDSHDRLVNPITFKIDGDPYQLDVSHRLAGLAPGTTYHADLRISPHPCPPETYPDPNIAVGKLTFTTDSKGAGNSNGTPSDTLRTETVDPFTVHLTPNPAKDEVKVSITSGKIKTIIVMDAYGMPLKSTDTGLVSEYNLNITGLPPGMHWLRTIRSDNTPLTVLLIISD